MAMPLEIDIRHHHATTSEGPAGLLREELLAAHPDLHAALERSWHIAANEWLPAVPQRKGTYNSYPHVRNLENHLARICRAFREYHSPDAEPLLAPIETYVLLMSVLLHDIGKALGKEPHSEEAYRIITSDHLRLGVPDRHLATIIARICRCHGIPASKLGAALNTLTTRSIDPYGEVREHCCAALLILVDHMDATFRRVAPAYAITVEEDGPATAFRRLTGDVVVDLRGRAVKVVLGDDFDELGLYPDLVPLPDTGSTMSSVRLPPSRLDDPDITCLIDTFPLVLAQLPRTATTANAPTLAPTEQANTPRAAPSRPPVPSLSAPERSSVVKLLGDQLPGSLTRLVQETMKIASQSNHPSFSSRLLWASERIRRTLQELASHPSTSDQQKPLTAAADFFEKLEKYLRSQPNLPTLKTCRSRAPFSTLLVYPKTGAPLDHGLSLSRCNLLRDLYRIGEDTETNQQVLATIHPVLSAMGILLRAWVVEHHEHLFSICSEESQTWWLETHEPGLSLPYLQRIAATMWQLSTRILGEGSFTYTALADAMREPEVERARRAVRRIAVIASRHSFNQLIWTSRTHWRWRTTLERNGSAPTARNRVTDKITDAENEKLDTALKYLASPTGAPARRCENTKGSGT
jgi:hypothetical protein